MTEIRRQTAAVPRSMSSQTGGLPLDQLLEQVAAGNSPAFTKLYDQTSAHLFGIALRILRRRDWAEDALQETYLSIWRKASLYHHDQGSAKSWLTVLLRNRSLDRLRREAVRGSKVTGDLDDIIRDETPSPLDLACAGATGRRLQECLGALDDSPRRVLQMAYWDGLTHDELSERLSIPLGTVKSWIRRSLGKLRACLDL